MQHPWDQRDLARLCAEEDNGIERSRKRRSRPLHEWVWLITFVSLLVLGAWVAMHA